MLHTFARKAKVSSYKVGAKSQIVKFVQHIIEFKMNENHHKTPEYNLKAAVATVIVRNFGP